MSWKVEYESESAIVEVTASGQIKNEDARAQWAEVARLLNENQQVGVLVDYSDALSELTLPELWWLANDSFALGLPPRLRLALVLPRTRYRIESYEFFQLVFHNAGYEAKLFEQADAAKHWLAAPLSCRQRRHAPPAGSLVTA